MRLGLLTLVGLALDCEVPSLLTGVAWSAREKILLDNLIAYKNVPIGVLNEFNHAKTSCLPVRLGLLTLVVVGLAFDCEVPSLLTGVAWSAREKILVR